MHCNKAREQLPLLSGRDLPWLQTLAVRRHLRRCPECRRELVRLEAARDVFGTALRQPVDDELVAAVWRRVRGSLPARPALAVPQHNEISGGPRWPRFAIPALAAAAALALILAPGLRDGGHGGRHTTDMSTPTATVEGPHEPGTTVLTFQNENPDVTIIWFFSDGSVTEGEV